MMELTFSEVGQKLRPSDFEDLEKLIGMDVPDDLKAFYLDQNGGTPSLGAVPTVLEELFEFQYFLPIKYSNDELESTVEEEFNGLFRVGEPTFNKYCIPIGSTIFGDGVYYSLEKETFGSIFYYVHDTDRNLHFRHLAINLKALLECFRERYAENWE